MQPALKGAAAMFFQHPCPVSAGYFLQLVGLLTLYAGVGKTDSTILKISSVVVESFEKK